jgi:hypothetical protein
MDFRTVLVMAAVLLLAAPAQLEATRLPHRRRFDVPGVFAFGDSLADVGTNNFLPQATAKANASRTAATSSTSLVSYFQLTTYIAWE